MQLHWLPVQFIQFKVLLLTYQSLHALALRYLILRPIPVTAVEPGGCPHGALPTPVQPVYPTSWLTLTWSDRSLSSQVSRGRGARTAWGPGGHQGSPGSLEATASPGRGARRGPRGAATWPPATRPTASCGRSTTARGRTTSVVPPPPPLKQLTSPQSLCPKRGLPDPYETRCSSQSSPS